MAFPCCNLCYVKYLESTGEVDLESLQTFIDENTTPETRVKAEDIAPTLCKCDCHTKGRCVMH